MSSYADVLEKTSMVSKVRKMKPNLITIKQLCEIYNHPQNDFPTIHVAGTNGKGSVCAKMAACLQKTGYKVGLYTSPHITTFRERVQINGEMISEEEVHLLFDRIQVTLTTQNIAATFFEIGTLLAFLYFKEKQVDVAVIEVGLGGRWDATNVITPLISVISSIGYDHTDILGPTLIDIAQEKAGIIKRGVPLVIGPSVPFFFMKKITDELSSSICQNSIQTEDFDYENQETARLALSYLSSRFPLSKQSLEEGLKAKPQCRFEQYNLQKDVVFDVAHNEQGFDRLIQLLFLTYPDRDFRFVVGFSEGKDLAECSRIILENACAVHLVSGEHRRLASVTDLQEAFSISSIPVYTEKTIEGGIQNALQTQSLRREVVVIAGSFFIMTEARKALGIDIPKVIQASVSL